jgi:hypothetical protein
MKKRESFVLYMEESEKPNPYIYAGFYEENDGMREKFYNFEFSHPNTAVCQHI